MDNDRIGSAKIKTLINYWIEVKHIYNEIVKLVEDTDEVGERFEEKDWWLNDQTGEGISVMDVHALLEKSSDKCYDLMSELDSGIQALLFVCLDEIPEVFGKYKSYADKKMLSELSELLITDVSANELYHENIEKQFEKFCKVVQNCCEYLVSDRKKNHNTDRNNLPFN